MANTLTANIITLFPEMFDCLSYGVTGRAIREKKLLIRCFNLRDYSNRKNKQVDDRPYGGQCGMVLQYEPLKRATEDILSQSSQTDIPVILTCPKGELWQQQAIEQFVSHQEIIIVCGRYQGIDQRYIDRYVTQTWSIGNYVLTGGELAGMVILDSVTRSMSGVLGNSESYDLGTHQSSEKEPPLYTRPYCVDGEKVPDALMSGDPKQIEQWKNETARKPSSEA